MPELSADMKEEVWDVERRLTRADLGFGGYVSYIQLSANFIQFLPQYSIVSLNTCLYTVTQLRLPLMSTT